MAGEVPTTTVNSASGSATTTLAELRMAGALHSLGNANTTANHIRHPAAPTAPPTTTPTPIPSHPASHAPAVAYTGGEDADLGNVDFDEFDQLVRLTREVQHEEIKLCMYKNMDDGYLWDVYGSTSRYMADGRPQRKAYYRCSNSTSSSPCSVKKVVQAHPEVQEVVIVTYKGRHNHPIHNAAALERYPILEVLDTPFDASMHAAALRAANRVERQHPGLTLLSKADPLDLSGDLACGSTLLATATAEDPPTPTNRPRDAPAQPAASSLYAGAATAREQAESRLSLHQLVHAANQRAVHDDLAAKRRTTGQEPAGEPMEERAVDDSSRVIKRSSSPPGDMPLRKRPRGE